MIYDAVICVSSRHKDISLKAIRSLFLFSKSRKFFVITSRQNFPFFEKNLRPHFPVHLLNEDQLMENVCLRRIQEILDRRVGSHRRAGWYFQQFLKMSACHLPDVADHYLVWDSDTLLLQPLDFFGPDGRVLVNPQTEYHKPYFDLIRRILGVERQVDFSFITENFMINKSYMKELILTLAAEAPGGTSWVELILNSIDDQYLDHSGFSEYETYGNFIALKHGNSIKCRPIKSTRRGAMFYGMSPNKYDLFILMQAGYAFATFEVYDRTSNILNSAAKVLSTIYYALFYLTNHSSEQRSAAAELSR
jgi:Family of unknown function (DUF6492)